MYAQGTRRDMSSQLSLRKPNFFPLTCFNSFGFLDGVSQPAVEGVDDPEKVNPGQQLVPPKVILLVQEDDTKDGKNKGPSWALNGSFLAFRHLSQLVPEFNKFLEDHAIPGLPPKDGAELLGARLMGRWKSGMLI